MGRYLGSIFSSIAFTDVIDIIIVAIAMYEVLKFIRSSRAEQLAKGLIFIIVADFLSEVCHFYTVNWILSKLLDVGLIALVVVFQPELRRALEFLGRGKFGTRQFTMNRERISDNVASIVRAVDYFSGRKEGAIIILERETALQDIAETGTIVDSKLSEEALENIFYKGAPLHDGAAIIRNDRIYAAGCVLPLTENQNLSKDLGTRHRAGIGISEASDALVLIVSEETGIISMAQDGRLSRFLDLKTVEKNLYAVYMSKIEGKSAAPFKFTDIWRKDNDGTQKNV